MKPTETVFPWQGSRRVPDVDDTGFAPPSHEEVRTEVETILKRRGVLIA